MRIRRRPRPSKLRIIRRFDLTLGYLPVPAGENLLPKGINRPIGHEYQR